MQLIKPDDTIIISGGSGILYNYYKKYFDIQNPVIIEENLDSSDEVYTHNLQNLKKGKTYYWIYAHHKNKFKRLEAVYNWAKEQKNFRIYADKKGNALIIFTI